MVSATKSNDPKAGGRGMEGQGNLRLFQTPGLLSSFLPAPSFDGGCAALRNNRAQYLGAESEGPGCATGRRKKSIIRKILVPDFKR